MQERGAQKARLWRRARARDTHADRGGGSPEARGSFGRAGRTGEAERGQRGDGQGPLRADVGARKGRRAARRPARDVADRDRLACALLRRAQRT